MSGSINGMRYLGAGRLKLASMAQLTIASVKIVSK